MPPTQNKIDYRKFFYSLGLELTTGSQLQGDCLFCERDSHFFVSPQTGQWDCKLCGETGNAWTFLTAVHKLFLSQTNDDHYAELSESRGIKPETLKHQELVKSPINDRWLIPVHNPEGKLTNLYNAIPTESGGYNLISLPTPCSQLLYRAHTIKKTHTHVWVLEGQWDTLLWLESLASLAPTNSAFKLKGRPNFSNEILKTNAIVGVPGATTFKAEWAKLLKDKHVILLYDNDEAGGKGIARVTKILCESKQQPSSLQKLQWGEDEPNDVRDLLYV